MKPGHGNLSREQHRKLGATLFNQVWDLMEKKDRSREEDADMIRDAHASRFHWGEAGTTRNLAVGEWQIARVYSLLRMPESALYHAKRSLAYNRAGGEDFEDFHLPSAYEGLARAYATAGDQGRAKKYLAMAERLSKRIKDPEDKKTILEQIRSVPIPRRHRSTKKRCHEMPYHAWSFRHLNICKLLAEIIVPTSRNEVSRVPNYDIFSSIDI